MSHSNQLDLLLINPGERRKVYQDLSEDLTAYEPPVWAGLIANFALKKGYSVEILDSEAENLTPDETARRVKELDPLLTAIVVYGHHPSASTQNMPAVRRIASAIKKQNDLLKLLLVGGHVAALPARSLKEEEVDFTASGEGLYTIAGLIEILKSGHTEKLSHVQGLYYRQGGVIVSTPPAPIIQNLDSEMPGIQWDCLPMDRYVAHNWHCFGMDSRRPYAAIYTTLGCPYHCAFCCIQAPFKAGEQALGFKAEVNSYRFWSPETVVAQIDLLVQKYGVRHIKFADELFVLNRRHVEGICDLLIERDYGLNIWAYARIDSIKEDLLEKLLKAGLRWLALGIEAGDAHVRKGVQKGIQEAAIYDVVRMIKDAGIHIIGNYIFGLPDDDRASMQATLDMALELNCEFANFYSMMAYPGSRLYEEAVEASWPLPETWSGYSQYSEETLPLSTKHLSGGEVLAFRDYAFDVYYKDQRYLDFIREKFGLKTAEEVSRMTHVKLRRRYADPEFIHTATAL